MIAMLKGFWRNTWHHHGALRNPSDMGAMVLCNSLAHSNRSTQTTDCSCVLGIYLENITCIYIYIYTHYFMMMMMMVIVFYYYCVFLLLSLFILLLAYVYTYVNVSQGRRKIPPFRSCLETSKRHRAHISHSYLHIPIYGYIPLKINSYPWTLDITSINIH